MNDQNGQKKEGHGPDCIIPGRLLDSGVWFSLTQSAQNIYVVIRRHVNQAGITQMTLPGIAARANVSRRTLHTALNELETKRVILKRQKMGEISRQIIRKEAPPNTWFFWTDPPPVIIRNKK